MLRTGLLLIVLITVVSVVALTTTRPAQTPAAVAPLPAATAAERPGEADPNAITLDDAKLTTQANRALAGQTIAETPLGPAIVEKLSVRVEEGQLRAEGTARAGAVSLPIAAAFNVDVRDGRPVVAVRSASVGGVPLPDPALRTLEHSAQAPVDQAVSEQRVRVQSVTMRPGILTLVTAR